MRYTIGVKMEDKITHEKNEGIYAFGEFGFPFILTNKSSVGGSTFRVFNTYEEATLYCQILTRVYRRDDVWASPTRKSRKIRKFYPIKVDSTKFRCLLPIPKKTHVAEYRNRFNEKQKNPTCYYDVYDISTNDYDKNKRSC